MIEKIVLDYLSESLTVPVYVEKPKNPKPSNNPLKFVVIEKTGSSSENHLYSSLIAVQSYAGSVLEAAELNCEIIEKMMDLVQLDEVTKVVLNSDYNFTDTSTKQPRYQAVFDIYHYGG